MFNFTCDRPLRWWAKHGGDATWFMDDASSHSCQGNHVFCWSVSGKTVSVYLTPECLSAASSHYRYVPSANIISLPVYLSHQQWWAKVNF